MIITRLIHKRHAGKVQLLLLGSDGSWRLAGELDKDEFMGQWQIDDIDNLPIVEQKF